ncbi:hypothetical protein AaE_012372, partial [Aphanomyces astaci]
GEYMEDVDMKDDRHDGSFSSLHITTSTHSSEAIDTGTPTAEYWKQHGALKASYLDEVNAVYNDFRARIMDSSSDESAERQQQLEYYMEFVAFCKLVLEESAASQDAIRPWEDLARVRKYIQSVVTPYMAKMAPPSAATSTATQGTNRHELDNSNVHVAWTGRRHNSSRGGRPAIDRSVGGVPASSMNHHHASSSSVTSPLGGTSSQVSMESDDVDTQSSAGGGNATEYWRQEHLQDVEHLRDYAAYCRQVLTEVQPSPRRTLQELHHVYTYITTLVLPHFASLQAADTVQQQQQQPPGQPKTSEEAVALETHRRQTNQHTELFLQSIDHQQQHPPCRPDNKDIVGSRASTFESSTFYGLGASSTYWRKEYRIG